MPAGAKAERVSDDSGASVIRYLRKGLKIQCNSCEREGSKEEKYGRSNPSETPRSVKKEVGGVLGMGAEIPLQPMEKVMVKQFVLLEPMEFHSGADPPCSPWRIP